MNKLQDICMRLEHLSNTGEWIARAYAEQDCATSQTGVLVTMLVDDVREKLLQLVTELEREVHVSNQRIREVTH